MVKAISTLLKIEIKRTEKKHHLKSKKPIDPILNLENKIYNFDNELILIYQMGKVASSTIYKSLIKRSFNTLHFHHLTDKTSSQLEYITKHSYVPVDFIESILRGNLRSKFLLNRIFLNDSEHLKNIKIISIVREPVGYLISAFFQNYLFFYNYFSDKSEINEKYSIKILNPLKKYFLNYVNTYLKIYTCNNFIDDDNYQKTWSITKRADLRHFLLLCRWPLIWFDREMNSMFDFDIYNFKFDKSSGFNTYDINSTPKLVFKMEKFKDIAKKEIGSFVNDDKFEIINDNVSGEKHYKSLYKEFCSSITLPEEFIELQYSSKYAKFFYTNQELNRFKSKWT